MEPSGGAWASPIALVKKKDGLYKFCVDFRRLNGVTNKDDAFMRGAGYIKSLKCVQS